MGPRLFEIRKLSSITRFDNETKKKLASLPILVLDSRSRFTDLSVHSQPWLQLASEVGSEKSDRQDTMSESPILSLEQMVSRLHHLTATVSPHNELGAEPRRLLAPSEDVQAPAKPLRGQAAERAESEPDRDCHPDETTMSEVVVGCHGLS